MEKLLDAIASELKVRVLVKERFEKTPHGIEIGTMQMFDYRDVTDEERELFKKEFHKHLVAKLQEMRDGESVEYGSDYEGAQGIFIEGANDNLAEVLLKLPTLKDGETYSLPFGTYICITLTEKDKKTISANVCKWIMKAYEEK